MANIYSTPAQPRIAGFLDTVMSIVKTAAPMAANIVAPGSGVAVSSVLGVLDKGGSNPKATESQYSGMTQEKINAFKNWLDSGGCLLFMYWFMSDAEGDAVTQPPPGSQYIPGMKPTVQKLPPIVHTKRMAQASLGGEISKRVNVDWPIFLSTITTSLSTYLGMHPAAFMSKLFGIDIEQREGGIYGLSYETGLRVLNAVNWPSIMQPFGIDVSAIAISPSDFSGYRNPITGQPIVVSGKFVIDGSNGTGSAGSGNIYSSMPASGSASQGAGSGTGAGAGSGSGNNDSPKTDYTPYIIGGLALGAIALVVLKKK